MMDASDVATALRTFAERVERLPAHDRRNPHAFTEVKSDLAADLVALADVLTARTAADTTPCSASGLPRRFRRPR